MTTKTTKIAEAISILSEILSAEVATENHPFDNTEEYVDVDTYDALSEASDDYQAQVESSLEEIQMTLQDVAGDELDDDDESWIVPAWVDVADEEPDTSKDSDESDITDSETAAPTVEEALSAATNQIDVLEAQIEEYKSAFRVLNNTVSEALEENNSFRETLLLEEM